MMDLVAPQKNALQLKSSKGAVELRQTLRHTVVKRVFGLRSEFLKGRSNSSYRRTGVSSYPAIGCDGRQRRVRFRDELKSEQVAFDGAGGRLVRQGCKLIIEVRHSQFKLSPFQNKF